MGSERHLRKTESRPRVKRGRDNIKPVQVQQASKEPTNQKPSSSDCRPSDSAPVIRSPIGRDVTRVIFKQIVLARGVHGCSTPRDAARPQTTRTSESSSLRAALRDRRAPCRRKPHRSRHRNLGRWPDGVCTSRCATARSPCCHVCEWRLSDNDNDDDIGHVLCNRLPAVVAGLPSC